MLRGVPDDPARPCFPSDLTAVRDTLDARFRATPMHVLLGIELLAWGPGWATTALQAGPDTANLAGSVHGGATFALADAAFEVACNSYGRLAVALETTCHYHRPAPVGARLVADALEVSRGGRTGTYRLEVHAGADLVTSYLALAYLTSRWHVPQERIPSDWIQEH